MVKYKISGAAILSLLAIFILATIVCAQDDIKEHRHCTYCGMDRKAYGFSRMLLSYDDGTSVGVCSLHCLAIELQANPARKVKSIGVADRDTRILKDAEKAFWVIGGKKPGVMTMTPKWAFAENKDAEKFLKEYGGRPASFAEVLGEASRELAGETGRIPR
jgi:copper chaperone NosL